MLARIKILAWVSLLRLDRPIGFYLLLWPVIWAFLIHRHLGYSLGLLPLFLAGGILMRSAGCIINDLIDHKLDAQVKRTQHRPIAAKQISKKEALCILTLLLLLASTLLLFLNALTVKIAIAAVILSALYPVSKYLFIAPQLILGLTFNLGVLMVFSAVQNTLSPLAYFVYSLSVLWTIYYDTQYALTDLSDDIKIGINSTAILFGNHALLLIGILQLLMLAGLVLLGEILSLNIFYYLGVLITSGFFIYQYYLVKHQATPLQAFKNNHWVGMCIALSLLYP